MKRVELYCDGCGRESPREGFIEASLAVIGPDGVYRGGKREELLFCHPCWDARVKIDTPGHRLDFP